MIVLLWGVTDSYDSMEMEFRDKTVGLVSAAEFRKAAEELEKQRLEAATMLTHIVDGSKDGSVGAKRKVAKVKSSMLSFGDEDGSDAAACAGETEAVFKRVSKNPSIFLLYAYFSI